MNYFGVFVIIAEVSMIFGAFGIIGWAVYKLCEGKQK